jgi:hypothetical protein
VTLLPESERCMRDVRVSLEIRYVDWMKGALSSAYMSELMQYWEKEIPNMEGSRMVGRFCCVVCALTVLLRFVCARRMEDSV